MMSSLRTRLVVPAIGLAAMFGIAACGSDGSELTGSAAEGRSLYRSNGCQACHGPNADGGVGPALAGLYGTEVSVIVGDDDETIEQVVADRAYLTESIADPRAKRVDGYSMPMPTNQLTDEQIAAIVDYIEAIGDAETAP